MSFPRWLAQLRERPWYILTRCTILSAIMLLSALLALVWADATAGPGSLLLRYCADTLDYSPVVFFSGLFASAFLEQILERQD